MVDCLGWDAWYDRMPGSDPDILHVVGQIGCPSSATSLSIDYTNEGVMDDSALIALLLMVDEPAMGDDQYVEKEIPWSDRVAGIETVRIHGPCPQQVRVREVS